MSTKKVVILGGGFGGAFTARYLRKHVGSKADIELINHTNYFVFQPLLPEVAAGIIAAQDAVTPLRVMLPGIDFRMAKAYEVDFDNRFVHVLQGSGRVPIRVFYDHLVLAVGQKTNLAFLPGFEEHSLTLRTPSDAYALRNQIIQCLEHADVTEDQALKKRLLTFVVAGGGFSGVEAIGEMTEMVRRTLRHYPKISAEEIRPILVQRDSRILPELSPRLSEYATKKLKQRGVDIRVNCGLLSATGSVVELDDGTNIGANTLLSTIGNGPSDFVQNLGIDLQRGKIPTDSYLRVRGHNNVWALGDAALIALDSSENEFAPPTAQFATAEAKQVAANIAATMAGKPPKAFSFRSKGALASIGHYSAVVETFNFRISGLLAWFMWRGFYILRLPGITTKIRVTLNWFFDYILPRNIVQIESARISGIRFARYKKGDVLFRPGHRPDGLYAVVSGALESRIRDEVADEDFVRIVGVGDHWGERTLTENWETKGTLVALEDTRVLKLMRRDFDNLRTALPVLEEYFNSISDESYARSLRRATKTRSDDS